MEFWSQLRRWHRQAVSRAFRIRLRLLKRLNDCGPVFPTVESDVWPDVYALHCSYRHFFNLN